MRSTIWNWRSKNGRRRSAPAAIVATRYEGGDPAKGVKMTRPLCPYPQVAKYNGQWRHDDAGNFVCEASK